MFPIRKILHPTDFSDPSHAAFEMACALARDYGAELVVAHVIPPPVVFAPNGIVMPGPVEESYETRVKLAAIRSPDDRVRVHHRLLDGDPVEQILKLVGNEHADLIVMGTHGATGLTRLLMGSVAESVMRNAACPVLTIRAAQHAAVKATPEPVDAARK